MQLHLLLHLQLLHAVEVGDSSGHGSLMMLKLLLQQGFAHGVVAFESRQGRQSG